MEERVEVVETEVNSLKAENRTVTVKEYLGNLNNSMKAISLECEHCDQKFSKAILLENHMVEHVLVKKFSCEVCSKQFHLKLRLKEHVQSHSKNSRVHHCHYFNNDKECLFISVGCM